MNVSEFDFALPPELIAQFPSADRGGSRLLVLDRAAGTWSHTMVAQLPAILRSSDLLVLNDTRVFPARLLGHRVPSGGAVECLLVGHLEGDRWEALMHPGQKLKPGARVRFERAGGTLEAEILERKFHGRRVVRLWREDGGDVDHAIEAIGHVPLPPYIKRADEPLDRERYQTVYARASGSVAAPTAGLHLSDALLDELRQHGVERAHVTLHIGYGTFKPVRTERVEDHVVDSEWTEIGEDAAAAINRAKDEGRRVIAVGTTTTRTLESAGREGNGHVAADSGATNLFIHPGFTFHVVDALLTNFHLPRSSLLMLVAAFAGRELVLAAYRDAVAQGYRFYSYGDAMLVV
ncbi:MAG: tRNA preQ1(34) S-adenosylmethionine ribosyltransferase-isomerase QueA [Bacteroidales bacterium]